MTEVNDKTLSLRVPKALDAQLSAAAEAHGISKSLLIKEAIERYLKEEKPVPAAEGPVKEARNQYLYLNSLLNPGPDTLLTAEYSAFLRKELERLWTLMQMQSSAGLIQRG